jgi:catechol 2,3-dioxygenase-like lactoylglutathione lyase family enzyme
MKSIPVDFIGAGFSAHLLNRARKVSHVLRINHYGLVVRNLENSLAFYEGVLGAKIVYRGFIPPTKTDVVYLQIAGGMIELLHRADQPPDEIFGITHLAFMTDDLDADYARLVSAGYEGLVQPKVAGSGVGRLAFIRDPNGARVELIQRDLKMRNGSIEHPIVKSFDHYSLTANNLDGALKRYSRHARHEDPEGDDGPLDRAHHGLSPLRL